MTWNLKLESKVRLTMPAASRSVLRALVCALGLALAAVAQAADASADKTDKPADAASAVPATPVVAAGSTNRTLDPGAFSTMETLDDKHKLAMGDKCSFRIVEDQDDPNEPIEPKPLIVTDSGDVEVPYIGRFPGLGKTCKTLAMEIKKELEKEYYYQATVIIALDVVTKSAGKVYLVGQLRAVGAIDIPGDEVFTISKAILRSGGFSEYADKKNVKLTRKSDIAGTKTQTFVINLNEILEKGNTKNDMRLESGDLIFVPSRLINF